MFAVAGTLEVALFSFDTVDATGCEDTFMGAMLAGRASGYTLVDAAQTASFVYSYVACGHGA